MTEIVVTLPPVLQDLVDARLAERGYVDAAEYVRDLMRRDTSGRGQADHEWLRAAIAEGEASGIIDMEPEDVVDAIMAEDPDLHG